MSKAGRGRRDATLLSFLLVIGWPTSQFSEPIRWAILAAGLPLVSRLDFRAVDPAVWWPVAGLVAYSGVTLFWSPDPLVGAWYAAQLAMLGLTMAAAAERGSIDGIMFGAGLGLAVNAVAVVAQEFGWAGMPQFEAPTGFFYNRDFLAEAAALGFVYAAARYRGKRDEYWGMMALGSAVPLVLCGSRVAIAAAAAGLAVGFRRVKSLALIVGVSISIMAAWSSLGNGKLASLDQRVEVWLFTWNMVSWFGHGLGSFRAAWPAAEYAHSDLLQALAEIGIVPLSLAFGLWGGWRVWDGHNIVFARHGLRRFMRNGRCRTRVLAMAEERPGQRALNEGSNSGLPTSARAAVADHKGVSDGAFVVAESSATPGPSETENQADEACLSAAGKAANIGSNASRDAPDLRERAAVADGRVAAGSPAGSDAFEADTAGRLERVTVRGAVAAGLVEVVVAFPLHMPVTGFLLAVLAGDLARRRDRIRRPLSDDAVAARPVERATATDLNSG